MKRDRVSVRVSIGPRTLTGPLVERLETICQALATHHAAGLLQNYPLHVDHMGLYLSSRQTACPRQPFSLSVLIRDVTWSELVRRLRLVADIERNSLHELRASDDIMNVLRLGRCGSCDDCPTDAAGFREIDRCAHTDRYDHWLRADGLPITD